MASFENAIKDNASESNKELWISWMIDKTARAHFESKGWKITENANDILLKDQKSGGFPTLRDQTSFALSVVPVFQVR